MWHLGRPTICPPIDMANLINENFTGEIHTEWRILTKHETDSLTKLMSRDKFYNSQHGRTNKWELLHIKVCTGAWPDNTTIVDNQTRSTSMAEFSGIPRSPANADDGSNFYKLKLAIKNLANENYQSIVLMMIWQKHVNLALNFYFIFSASQHNSSLLRINYFRMGEWPAKHRQITTLQHEVNCNNQGLIVSLTVPWWYILSLVGPTCYFKDWGYFYLQIILNQSSSWKKSGPNIWTQTYFAIFIAYSKCTDIGILKMIESVGCIRY